MKKTSVKKMRRMTALITAVIMTAGIISGCSDAANSEEGTTSYQSEADGGDLSVTSAEETSETTAAEPTDSEEDITATNFSLSPVVTEVTADSTEGSLILTDTDFTLKTSSDMEDTELRSLLSFTPEIPFELTKTAECEYKLDINGNFPENSTAVLALADEKGDTAYKWAFQTYGDFEALEYYPSDGSESADTHTGIEIRFSSAVTTENAKDHFSISPNVPGSFKAYRSTLYFIPDRELEPNTYYNITVKQGFCSADGAPLKDDISFTFRTQRASDGLYCYTPDDSETFIPGDTTLVEIYCSDVLRGSKQEYKVELLRYNSADDYYNALKDYAENGIYNSGYTFKSDGMKTAYTDTVTLQYDTRKNYGPAYLMLPDNLEKGYYLANISTEYNETVYSIQKHIQISDISVYSSDLNGNTVFFVNDVNTGNAASGAEIMIERKDGIVSGTADSQGIANIDIASEKYGTGMVKISYKGEVFCDLYSYNADRAESADDLYFSYIYTDREAYLTTDKVNIWGVVIPRRSGISMPTDMYINMQRYSDEVISEDIPVKVDANGFFTTSIDLENHTEMWSADICLFGNDMQLCSKYITIKDYEKPTYTYDITLPEYAMYPQSVPVEAEIDVSFYEGTPASGVKFSASGYDLSQTKDGLITDSKGHIETELLFNDETTWRPQNCYVTFTPSGIQDEYSYVSDYFIGFFRDIMLTHETDHDKNSVTFYTNKVDPSNVDFSTSENYYYDYFRYDYEKIKGEPADTTVNAVLHRSWYTKVAKGSYYDFLQKKTVKNYEYEYHEEIVDSYTAATYDGKAVLTDLPIDIEDSHYWMELTWKDTLGNTVEDSINLTEYIYEYDYGNYRYYTFGCDDNYFTENEVLEFSLDTYRSDTSFEGGRILFQVFRNEFLSNTIYTTETFTHKMTADYIPDVDICGAYFDGRHVYPVNTSYYYCYKFDPSERNIELEVTANKETYLPGDSASITVKAVDMDGNPVSGAAIHLSVVDEAAFAVADQVADPLDNIYRYVYTGYPTQYYSYIQHCLDTYGGAEKGGGGDDYYIRKDFKDTALFLSAQSDADGCAAFNFKLPDNLTTWRATAQAIKEKSTGVVYAGTKKYPVVVTQPLFIMPIAASEYLEGDDVCVSATCFGDSNKDETITVTLSGNNYEKVLSVPSGSSANFGKLPIGEYKVLFTAEGNGGKDAIELPLTVTDTLLEAEITKPFDLAEGIEIDPVRWPVKITFFDKEYMEYTDILFALCSKYYDRLDMQVASQFAYKELGFITEDEFISRFAGITNNGMLRLMESSQESAELTALVCLAAPELIDKSSVRTEMYNIVDNSERNHSDRAYAYLALAAIGEPVGNEMARILDETDDLDRNNEYATSAKTGYSYPDCMILCTALAASGDFDRALKHYSSLANKAVIGKDENGKATMLIKGPGSDHETTAMAIMTASILGLDEADLMARYLVNTTEIYDTYVLELMVYLKNYTPDIEGDAVFTYKRGDKTETVELDRHFGTCLYFTKDQLKNADFKVTSGGVYAITNYTGRVSEYGEKQTIKVTKSIQGKMEKGSLVTVRITISNAERNTIYRINDVIPSCGRYVGDENYSDNKITRWVYNQTGSNLSIEYQFRIVADGEYVVESAAVRNCEGDWGMSRRNTIEVQGNDISV